MVDPGVGSERPILAVEAWGAFIVGPDNGLLDRALRRADKIRAVRLPEATGARSWTFESRDVMAPAAGPAGGGAPLGSRRAGPCNEPHQPRPR